MTLEAPMSKQEVKQFFVSIILNIFLLNNLFKNRSHVRNAQVFIINRSKSKPILK